MKRNKKNKEETVKPGSSSKSQLREEHDLAYYVHDRVALMREVFTVLKAKDIKKITPACVGNLSIDDLEELCLEELLGISSKRVCAILDGAEPPSDTDSSDSDKSSKEDLEIISLSSSGESRKSGSSKKRKNKSKKQKHKEKRKKKTKCDSGSSNSTSDAAPLQANRELAPANAESVTNMEKEKLIRATRAGMTVLELLELEARARAIKAQLEKASIQPSVQPSVSTDPDVEIKEEEQEILVISSDEEKPDVEAMEREREAQRSAREKEDEIVKEREKETQLELLKQQEEDKKAFLEKQKNKLENKKQDNEERTKKKLDKKDQKEKQEAIERDKKRLAKIEKKIALIQQKEDDVIIIEEDSPPEETKKQEKQKTKQSDLKKSDKNDLTITIPTDTHTNRKVKMNRHNVVISVTNVENTVTADKNTKITVSCVTENDFIPKKKLNSAVTKVQKKEKLKSIVVEKNRSEERKRRTEEKAKKKRDREPHKEKVKAKEDVDQDEITLQLSDSEKLDLLEDLDGTANKERKESSDSESSSEGSSDDDEDEEITNKNGEENNDVIDVNVDKELRVAEENKNNTNDLSGDTNRVVVADNEIECLINMDRNDDKTSKDISKDTTDETLKDVQTEDVLEKASVSENMEEKTIEITSISDIPLLHEAENRKERFKNDTEDSKDESEVPVSDLSNIKKDKEISEHRKEKDENEEIISKGIDTENNSETEITVEDENNKEIDTDINTAQIKDCNLEKESDLSAVSTESYPDKQDGTDRIEDNLEKDTILDGTEKSKNIDLSDGEIADKDEEEGEIRQSDLSEGEITDKSSEVEAFDVPPAVFCISDEDEAYCEKNKKSKKEKKSKKSKNFRKVQDENFYKEPINVEPNIVLELVDIVVSKKEDINKIIPKTEITNIEKLKEELKAIEAKLNGPNSIVIDDDEVLEIMELSDDSSCYEVEGTCLSKEPTAEEIEALSARIDEIKREDVVTDEQILEHERGLVEKNIVEEVDVGKEVVSQDTKKDENVDDGISKVDGDDETAKTILNVSVIKEIDKNDDSSNAKGNNEENIENISWKDRYLDSSKVKKVLSTSNILNALRKKNLELKKKMVEAKKAELELQERLEREKEIEKQKENEEIVAIEEGSIEQYKTLQGSTKYVDPVEETSENVDKIEEKNADPEKTEVTKDMKKDAKQLLKMFKRLLKFSGEKDPNKAKKKKKHKKDRTTKT